MRKRSIWCMIVILAVAASLTGCPPSATTTYKLYVLAAAPYPNYEFSQLMVSPASAPNSINQSDTLVLFEGNVLVVDGLVPGESYDVSILASPATGASWTISASTGAISGDCYFVLYTLASGDVSGSITTTASQRTLQP